ncbi:MAG: CD225/dispanin family protein [Muribaculaceae bacterium]|nr:CD225/dispanin family protein [Muribaculaceae bacterium]
MKYWVIFNNKQEGPFSLEELRQYPLTLQTPVWHQGLTQWVTAQEVDELRSLIEQKSAPRQNPYGQEPYVSRQPQEGAPYANTQPQQNPQPGNAPETNGQPRGYAPRVQMHPRRANGVERPSTYLGWAIAATLLCCLPLGVVAIIYAAGVNSKFDRGDIEGARKSSERAQLWIMLSVTLGLLWMPVYTLIQMLIQL